MTAIEIVDIVLTVFAGIYVVCYVVVYCLTMNEMFGILRREPYSGPLAQMERNQDLEYIHSVLDQISKRRYRTELWAVVAALLLFLATLKATALMCLLYYGFAVMGGSAAQNVVRELTVRFPELQRPQRA